MVLGMIFFVPAVFPPQVKKTNYHKRREAWLLLAGVGINATNVQFQTMPLKQIDACCT
jgi:hypothetical protein